MVSQNSSSHSSKTILQEFFISNSLANQNQHFDAYGTDLSNSPYPDSLPLSIHCLGERMSTSLDLVHAPQGPQLSDESDIGRPIDLLATSNEAAHQSNRLSLSLGFVPCQPTPLNSSPQNPSCLIAGAAPNEAYNIDFENYISDGSGSAPNQLYAAIGSSKYLQPTRALLEEMLSIGGKDIDKINQKYMDKLSPWSQKGSSSLSSKLTAEFSDIELLAEKHGNHINLLKLISLLEEVERRYEEYYYQLEGLVSSFEAVAGVGAGKSYMALALQAMSKHFCSLRNSILSQIHVTKQKIKDRDMPKISSRLSQLSLFDQEARQNRASLQTWRPIRGLPETAVTILRAWLFEHFLRPYPNDAEKRMLASKTGLSKNQVCNWFINARVRLWKPMIEEMYNEEFADSSTESDQLLTSSSTTREGEGDSAEDLN